MVKTFLKIKKFISLPPKRIRGKRTERRKLHKRKSRIKVKEETIYVNNDSFFKIFDIDKCTIEKDFVEANFFINDFFPNILEYYLNIIEIKYDDVEDELISNN